MAILGHLTTATNVCNNVSELQTSIIRAQQLQFMRFPWHLKFVTETIAFWRIVSKFSKKKLKCPYSVTVISGDRKPPKIFLYQLR
jgi:hypothetical protein